ncbi:MAG: Mrp/NBP35 family ATP-binding protein [Caldisericota bacterium]|nr:Mrp/NBP35 family ATP-binding protein [Caldisericota bacterium]
MPLQQTQVINVLKTTFIPGLKKLLLSFGTLQKIDIRGDEVLISIVIPEIPAGDVNTLKNTITKRLKDIGAKKVGLTVSFKVEQKIKDIIAIASGKGGVGKSTVSTNIAIALAKLGKKVGVLDADIHGPNLPIMFGIHEKPFVNENKRIIPLERYGVKVISIGFLVESSTPVIWRGPLVTKAIEQLYNDVEWGELDYLLIDLPPGTGDAALTVAQSLQLKYGIIITTPQDVSIADASKALKMFKKMNILVLGVIENMSYFICPKCGEKTAIFGHGGGERMSLENEVPLLDKIPLDTRIRESGDNGMPTVALSEETETKRIFMDIAKKLIKNTQKD